MFDPFDLNKDGKLDLMEGFLKYQFINGDEDDDDKQERIDELELEGLDKFDLELMDSDERDAAIEAAGLDPADYWDLFDD